MTQEALKLAEIIEHFDSNDEGLPLELLKEISATLRALAQTQEPVALQDDEIYDAAFSAYCRGENSRELFRIMWNSRLTCSIGWDRDELKSFARNIAAIYIHPWEKNHG